MWRSLPLLNALVLGAASLAYPVEPSNLKRSGDTPAVAITVTSNRMTVRNQDNQAVFDGSVILTRGPLVVYSDKMVVFFHSQNSEPTRPKGSGSLKDTATMSTTSNRSVDRVEAMGHVKIKQENGNATCQKAVYFSDEEKIILTGDPVAWEKGTRVSGKQITIYLAEERSVVEGDSHVRIEDERQSVP